MEDERPGGPMQDTPVVRESGAEEPAPRAVATKTVVALVVMALFAGLLAAKLLEPAGVTVPGGDGTSITSVRNDASADYQAALASGKPIYVLFHSLS